MTAKKTPRKKAPKKAPPPPPAPEPKPEPPVPSGWAKMKAAGKRGIMLSVSEATYAKYKRAADADQRTLAGWCVAMLNRNVDI